MSTNTVPTLEVIISNVELAHEHLRTGYESLDGAIQRVQAAVTQASCYGYDPRLAYALDDIRETVRRMPDRTLYDYARFRDTWKFYEAREPRVTANV